jgi:hypothetical protein
MPYAEPAPAPDVVLVGDIGLSPLRALFAPYGLRVEEVSGEIPGSYWGPPEAGLRGDALYVRADTPVHSALHEGCHYLCMDRARRRALDTDAGGEPQEENGVCYLQILLADRLPHYSAGRTMRDMDNWGYSFRLGSARAWFERDAEDARAWLYDHGLIDGQGQPSGFLRRD